MVSLRGRLRRRQVTVCLALAASLLLTASSQAAADGYLATFDARGMGHPEAVDVGPSGNVYVAALDDHRIYVFTPDGDLVTRFGGEGGGINSFGVLRGVAVDSQENVYAGDWWFRTVQKFAPDGTFLGFWEVHGRASVDDVAVDPRDNVLVLNDGQVKRFSPSSAALNGARGTPTDAWPTDAYDIDVDPAGNVYGIAYREDSRGEPAQRVLKYGPSGNLIAEWGSNAFSANLEGIGVDAAGNVYVADSDDCSVHRFAGDGRYLGRWGECDGRNPHFYWPYAIAADFSSGHVYVTDDITDEVHKFGPGGVEPMSAACVQATKQLQRAKKKAKRTRRSRRAAKRTLRKAKRIANRRNSSVDRYWVKSSRKQLKRARKRARRAARKAGQAKKHERAEC